MEKEKKIDHLPNHRFCAADENLIFSYSSVYSVLLHYRYYYIVSKMEIMRSQRKVTGSDQTLKYKRCY